MNGEAEGYVTLSEAAARLGLSEPALRRRVERGLIPTFSNPSDLRSRLIKSADLAAYATPQPVTPARREHEGGEVVMSA